MIHRKLIVSLFAFLVFTISSFIVSATRLASDQVPSAAVLRRYALWNDKFWMIQNETVQQLLSEGYDVEGAPNQLVQVNYTRLNTTSRAHTLKSKIVKIAWPNVTVQVTEGEYNLNVTVHKILGDGTIGEEIGSFLRENQPSSAGRLYQTWDPAFGPGFNPSALWDGNTFTSWLDYQVTGPETLYNTPWGQNQTFLLTGERVNSTHSFRNRVWCDAQTGIMLKQIWNQKMPNLVTHEEQMIIETGIESVKEPLNPLLIIGVSIVVVIVAGIAIYLTKIRRRKA